MKKVLFLLLLFIPPGPTSFASAHEIVVVQSARLKPYEEALQGFKTVCAEGFAPHHGLKSIQPYSITELVLSEKSGSADIAGRIRSLRPELILAIGRDALAQVKTFRDVPIIYLMVPQPQAIKEGRLNITGVDMLIPPAKQLAGLIEAIPKVKRVGLLYDPRRTGALVKEARIFAATQGIFLFALEVQTAKEVPGLIDSMKGEIDAFWMLPDLTVVTPQTVKALFLFSLENRIPVLTFSEKYLELGATIAAVFDVFAMGEQAGEMARRILAGTNIREVEAEPAEKITIKVNRKIAKKLGVALNPEILTYRK